MTEPLQITEAGVYGGIPENQYHADPVPEGSLSVSGAKTLLKAPALFAYEREHGRPPKAAFDFGHAAHREVLGVGNDILVVDAADWRTNKAKEAKAEAYAKGLVPVLREDHQRVLAMAAALRQHPLAKLLLADTNGTPEVSLFARDQRTGVMRRGRVDLLPYPRDGRLIVVDYKTTARADPVSFGKAAADYGYCMQAPWYMDLVLDCQVAEVVSFVFVVQEKEPPYLPAVYELDGQAVRIGRQRNRRALDLYAACTANQHWPGYVSDDDVTQVGLPAWYVRTHEELAS